MYQTKTYQDLKCLPMVIFEGKPAYISGVRYGDSSFHPLDPATWIHTKYYDLTIPLKNGEYSFVDDVPAHHTRPPVIEEEIAAVNHIAAGGFSVPMHKPVLVKA